MGGIETLDIIRMSLTAEEFQGFLKGNVLKYQIQAPHKHETPDEDYKKAKFYYDEYRDGTEREIKTSLLNTKQIQV